MEEIYLSRLTTFVSSIKSLTKSSHTLCALKSWSDDDMEQACIVSSKLQAVIHRFNNELYQYFNTSTNPNADDISNMTNEQLEGDEALAEMKARIQVRKDKVVSSNSSQSINRGKLPELNLPTFSGDVLQWTQFWDQFSSNIDQRTLRDVDKLLYLKASLKGEPKTILDGLETTNDNYKIAVTTLTDRYGKKTQIIDAHYSALHKLKGADKQDDCRKVLDEIERHLRVLSSLGENTEHNHLRFLILEKFPEDIVYELKLKLSSDTIEEIRKQLHLVLSAREDAKRTSEKFKIEDASYTTETLHVLEHRTEKGSKIHKRNNLKDTNKKFKPNVTAFNKTFDTKRKFQSAGEKSGQGPKQKRRKLNCIFCKGDHFNDECTDSKTLQQRKSRLRNRCFNCLRLGHNINTCRSKHIACKHCGKKGLHNRALCPSKESPRNVITKTELQKKESTSAMHIYERGSTILQTAVVNIRGPENTSMKCRVLLDSGSMRSYVTQDVAQNLDLKTEEVNHLTVFTFGSNKPQELDSPLVKLHIQSRTDIQRIVYANVVPSITHGISSCGEELSKWKYEKDYLLADDGSLSDKVDILIGNDYYHSLMSTEKVKIRENLYLVNSDLGWILSGQMPNKHEDELSMLTYFQASYETRLNEPDLPLDNTSMKALWDLESLGITDSPNANREEEAIKHFNETTVFTEERYYVSWPWKEYPPELPTNYGLAYGRLIGLMKRLDAETLSAYNQTLSDQMQRGIIELVPEKEISDHPIHYLPHHGILAPGKALRIVYDASAKTKNTKCLNECLYCGPMMLEDLTGLLLKFRSHAVGLTADVEKAFLQIGLKEGDRDVTRFLWLKDTNKPATEDNLLHYRFTRVPFGIISSPFLLNATVRHHLLKSNGNYAKQLANDIYVDNVVTGVETVTDALNLYKEAQIHCFTDASTVAYSAVVYLVQKDTVNFVIGKSRLVPTKDQQNLKIPRLELLGVLIGSRLIKYVLRFLPLNITQLTLWTDSQIVIDWYHSDKLLEPFVSKRLEEIKRNKSLIVRYVPSSLNPADVATRPITSEEERNKWLSGPEFLGQDPRDWPSGPPRNTSLLMGEGLLNTENQPKVTPSEDKVTANEPLDSQLQKIKELQKETFSEEYGGKKTNLAKNLGLFIDTDGILRCDGRLTYSDLSYDAKHPILLPKNSELTEKIIKETHEKNLHVGVPHTLSLIRQKFWIPQGRAKVQKTLSKCTRCVKHGGGPYELPKTPALPAERVRFNMPFAYVGVDYFGPMVIKTENGVKKRWISLFTCLVIRAIHLEVVKDLTTDECLMAFRRFIATRGTPSLIITDNAPQFRLLAEVMSEGTLADNLRWKFIPQLAPWHGGAYERLVAVVKHCLKRTLQKHMLGENQLSTIIKEVEAVVNTRPLTYVGTEMDHILKPTDFLTPGKCLNIQLLMNSLPLSGSIIRQQLIEGWKRGNMIMNEYKEMFINRYLLSLRERYGNSPKQARVRTREVPQVGDVVQIKGERSNRESWKVGKIVETLKGKDGLYRVARVKVDNHVFTRSIAHLYPLEIEEEETPLNPTDKVLDQRDAVVDNNDPIQTPSMKFESVDTNPTAEISYKLDNDENTNANVRHNSTQDTKEELENVSTINDIELAQDHNERDLEDEVNNSQKLINQTSDEKSRRAAAVQALEKIHKWTRDLMTTIV